MAGILSLWPQGLRNWSHISIAEVYYDHSSCAVSGFKSRREFLHGRSRKCFISSTRKQAVIQARVSRSENTDGISTSASRLDEVLNLATSLYPVYILLGGVLALMKPSAYSWFVSRRPTSYSLALGTIMLSMGFTLKLSDLAEVFWKRPAAIFFGFMAQYVIMPFLGASVSRMLKLSPMLSVGLILMACCPGGTASNVVTYIARGDVPLSVIMTVCTTIGAVFATPLLTLLYAGAYIPVDVKGLALSTLQVVLGPVLLGAWLQGSFPKGVASIKPFAPLAAVLISSLLASSVFSVNVALLNLKDGTAAASLIRVAIGVMIVHAGGFLLGYVASKLAGFSEPERRAISIEVGMQNSSLGVVLASAHFGSALACVPPAVSAVLMNIMGSGLAVVWRHLDDAKLKT